jgi:ABC-2 type transport system ATP-binding protein
MIDGDDARRGAGMAPAIVAQGLHKRFKSRRGVVEAVRDVSFQVASGEIVGLLGPNGAGKTTTLRMLTTLLPIDAGRATVAGHDVAGDPRAVRRSAGYVSQAGGADELATGRENLVLQGRLYGVPRDELVARVDEVSAALDLTAFADRRVKTYSGGQRRRLDVALGLVHRPHVLFLDEPTTGLDPQNRANLWVQLRGLRTGGTTIVLTTHYLEEADELCDRVVIVDHGAVAAQGTPRALKHTVAGDAVVITLRQGDDGQRVPGLLDRESYVRQVTVDGEQVRLYVDDGGAALPELLRLLDAHRVDIRSISSSEPTLDDVFLRQTGRSLRDAGPAEEVASEVAA